MEKKYQHIIKQITELILTEKYQTDQKLPTESFLMAEFDVSRHTIRRAFSDLEAQGFIYKVQGGGTYVAAKEKREAKQLGQSHTVAVLATHINDYIFPDIISGIEGQLSAEAYSLLLSSTKNNEKIEKRNITTLLNSNIQGLIVEPTQSAFKIENEDYYQKFIDRRIPIITIDAKFKKIQVPYFVMDDEKGGYVATEYLLKLGHRDILGIYKTDDQQGLDRMNGYILANQQAEQTSTGRFILYQSGESMTELESKIMSVLEDKKNRPSAIIAYNDEVALKVYAVAQHLHVEIPTDLSVIGFDDSLLAQSASVRLTSVEHPKRRMGEDAAKLIIKMINTPNKNFMNESVIYEPKLIVGESTRPTNLKEGPNG